MASATPRESFEILDHYFKLLFEAAGYTWSAANRRDMGRVVLGLAGARGSGQAVPPYPSPAAPPATPPAAPPRPATGYQTMTVDTSNPHWRETLTTFAQPKERSRERDK